MGLFSTTANIAETRNATYKIAKERNYQKLEEKCIDKDFRKEIIFRNEKFHALLKAELKENDSGCIFKITLSPDKGISRKITLFISLLSILILMGLLVTKDLISDYDVNLFHSSFYFGLIIYSIWLFRIYLTPISNRLKNEEQKIIGEFDNYITCYMVSPVETKIFQDWHSIILLLLFIIFATYFASGFRIVFPLVLILDAFILCSIFLKLSSKKIPKLKWKSIIIEFIGRWITLIFTVVLFFIWMYFTNLVIYSGYQRSQNKEHEFKNVINSYVYLPNLKKVSSDPIEENKLLLKKVIEIKLEKVQDKNIKQQLLGLDLILLSGFIANVIIQIIIYRYVFRIISDWKTYTASRRFVEVKSPPVSISYGKKSIGLFTYTFIGFLIAFIINWLVLLLSIDAIAFVFMEKPLIFKGSNVLFAWIPALFLSISDVLNFANDNLVLFGSKIFILLFIFPILWFIFRMALKMANIVTKILGYVVYHFKNKNIIHHSTKEFIKKAAFDNKTRRPLLIVSDSDKIEIRSANLIIKPVIIISKGALENLKLKELNAVLLHEIYHIKNNLVKINVLSVLSRIALSPNFFLLLLIDSEEIEFKADQFSINYMKNSKYLYSALLKVTNINFILGINQPKKSEGFIDGFLKKLRIDRIYDKLYLLDSFLYGPLMLGYSHPIISERLKLIQNKSLIKD